MSSLSARRDGLLSWPAEAHQLYADLLRWHAANAAALGRSPGWGLEQAKRAWLSWSAALAEPCPGQRGDGMLGTIYGDKNLLNKRSEMATIALKIVDYQRVVTV